MKWEYRMKKNRLQELRLAAFVFSYMFLIPWDTVDNEDNVKEVKRTLWSFCFCHTNITVSTENHLLTTSIAPHQSKWKKYKHRTAIEWSPSQ